MLSFIKKFFDFYVVTAFKVAKDILIRPKISMEMEAGFKDLMVYSFIISIVPAIVFGLLTSLSSTFFYILLAVFGPLTVALLIHFVGRFLKFNRNFLNTACSVVFASTPLVLFGWIPVVGPLFSLWSLMILIIILSSRQLISKIRAFASVVPVISIVLIGYYFEFGYGFLIKRIETKTISISGLQVAKSSISFIDSMKNKDGNYRYSLTCENNVCMDKDILLESNSWPALAYMGLYDATGDGNYLTKAKEEMDILLNKCERKEIDCSLDLIPMSYVYEKTLDEKYLDAMKKYGKDFSESEETLVDIVIRARGLAKVYKLTGNSSYLDGALRKFNELERIVGNESVFVFYEVDGMPVYDVACWNALTEIELYRATNNISYLDHSLVFLNKARFVKHTDEMNTLFSLVPCVDAMMQVYEITEIESYKNQAKELLAYILKDRWDSSGEFKKYNSDNGFLFESFSFSNKKVLLDSCYLVYLFSIFGSEEFVIII